MRFTSAALPLAALLVVTACGGLVGTDPQDPAVDDPSGSGTPNGSSDVGSTAPSTPPGPGSTPGAPPSSSGGQRCNASKPFVAENLNIEGRAPSLTRDESILVYEHESAAYERRRAPGQKSFGPATPFIAQGAMDVVLSPDGLALDHVLFVEGKGTAERSVRASLAAPFGASTPPASPEPALPVWRVANVGDETYFTQAWDQSLHVTRAGSSSVVVEGVVRWFAVSGDGRVLHYTRFSDQGVSTPFRARRAGTSGAFGAPEELTELATAAPGWANMYVTWVSDDDCVAYGWSYQGQTLGLFRAERGK